MIRVRISTLLIIIFAAFNVQADNISFKILNNVVKEVKAGVSVNLMAQFDNSYDSERTVEVRLKAKEDGWRLLTDLSSLILPKQRVSRKVIGVFVPYSQVAGSSSVVLEVYDKTSGAVIATETFDFLVQARYNLAVDVLRAPTQLFAGDTSSVVLLIRNESNLDVEVLLNQRIGSEVHTEQVKIAKEAAYLYTHILKIPKTITTNEQRSFTANVSVVDKNETNKSVYLQFDVYRIGQEKFDRFNRFNVQVAGVGAVTTAYGAPVYSWMYDVQGNGVLGKPEARRRLDFKLRGPNRSGNPLFGMNDEYYVQYTSKRMEVTLGDNNYGLSNLTESSRNGRGVGVLFNLNKLSIGGYYSSPRYYPLIRQVMSGYAAYTLNKHNVFQLGYLTKMDTTAKRVHLASLSAKNQLFPWLSSNLEFSMGEAQSALHKAYRVGMAISSKFIGSSIDYTYADTEFPGYFSNAQRFYGNVSFHLDPFSLAINYNTSHSKQALDTLMGKPPITQGAGVSTSVRFLKYFSMNVGAMMSSSKEDAPTPLFDYQRYNARVGLNANFTKVNVSLYSDGGKLRNFLVNSGTTMTNFFTTNFNTSMTVKNWFSANGNVSYQAGQKGVTGTETVYYSLGMASGFSEKFQLSFSYNSNFEWVYYTSDRNLFAVNLSAAINANNKVSLSTNYSLMKNTLDNKTFNAQFRYIHTLHVPISKRKDVGSLEGKLVNAGVETIAGIRISIAGRIAITDKDGRFKFSAIPVGQQTLLIDAASFGLHTIPERPGPYVVDILPAKTTFFELSVTKSARIQGTFEVTEDEKANQKGFIKVVERLERLVVEASSDKEVYRVMSDVNGGFKFEDLRPGNWTVKVYPNGLPKGYNLLTPQFSITLAPEQVERIVVKVEKKARQIQFQRKT